jgi:Family of unknown function (DUF5372)
LSNESLGSLVVTHPFHPLCGERLEVLYVRRCAGGRVYVCDGGQFGGVSLPEAATDRGPEPADRPLTVEVLCDLVAVVAAIGGGREEL